MKKVSKQVQVKDGLQQGYADDEGRAVVEDRNSRAIGPTPEKASVIKMLLDSFAEKLEGVGLILADAGVSWETDESPEQVYGKLRQLQLISVESGGMKQ
jgi:hypothetical protein